MTKGMKPAPFTVGHEEVATAIMEGLADNRLIVWVPGRLRWVFLVLVHIPLAIWRRLPG
jgi:hypothetical protein